MTEQRKKKISKYLSLILRHNPGRIKLKLDTQGWANVDELLSKSGVGFSFEEIVEVVATNDKQRFSFNYNKTKIRANQGHSIEGIDLGLEAQEPPQFLYHGTATGFINSIKEQGLLKMNRQHVHLSKDRETATKVGSRRGVPVILSVRSGDMFNNGHLFYLSDNGVWLTDHVPVEFIDFKE